MDSRKESILQSIIEEHICSACPVGSKSLAEFLGFSPATIRSEMAELEREGLITQPYTSAGRVPTEKGYRYYIDNVKPDTNFTYDKNFDLNSGVDKILKLISSASGGATSFCVTPKSIVYSGLSDTLGQKDFENQEKVIRFAKIIDNLADFIKSLEFDKALVVRTYVGEENPYRYARDFSCVVTCFPLESQPCVLGVIGPTRLRYKNIIPLLNKLSRDLSKTQLLKGPFESMYKDIYWSGE